MLEVKYNGEIIRIPISSFSDENDIHFQIENELKKINIEMENKKNICDFFINEKIFNIYAIPHISFQEDVEKEFFVKLIFLDKKNEIVELVSFINGEERGESVLFCLNSFIENSSYVLNTLIKNSKTPINGEKMEENKIEDIQKKPSNLNQLNFIN